MKCNKKTTTLLGIFFFCLLLSTQSQGATELIIQPSRFELLLSPGTAETQAITIKNNGSEAVRIGVDVRDWEMDEEGNSLFTLPGQTYTSCAPWFRFNPKLFQLAPGKEQIVRFSISAPSQIPAGEHRCAILFASQPMEAESTLTMVSNILVTIYGYSQPISRRGSVEEVLVKYEPKSGLELRCKINSTGNSHLRINGRFKILDQNNTVHGEGKYIGSVVFPGKTRFLTGHLPLKLPPGAYQVESEFLFIPPLYAGDLLEYEQNEEPTGFKNVVAFTIFAE